MKPDILYVDDEAENLIVFQAAFEDDFNILTANSGEEALALLEKRSVPVVVTDHRMPNMTGVELCELLRHKHPHTKRIILTGYSDSAAMLDAINKGQVFQFLTKPWDRNALLSVLYQARESHELMMKNMALTEQLVASERCATLGKVAAQVAHEMSNQICMLPLLELIEREYSDRDDLVQMATFASETHDRLVMLINEIKSFVRFEQDPQMRRPVRLSEALHEVISFLRFDDAIPQDRLTLIVRQECAVMADKVKIQQVVVNLLKNAAYAIRDQRDGQITLTLDRDAEHASLVVADNGCGMSEETMANIWKPFFSTKGDEGNGLGLEVCRQLVESHQGQIWCESALHAGTTFFIRLPAVAAESPVAIEQPRSRVVGEFVSP